jgi:hypothetical protein
VGERSRSALQTNGSAALRAFGEGRHQPGLGVAGSPAWTTLERDPRPAVPSGHDGAGVGLGVFIAQTPLARTGATLQFDNRNRGARAPICWRREALKAAAPEA